MNSSLATPRGEPSTQPHSGFNSESITPRGYNSRKNNKLTTESDTTLTKTLDNFPATDVLVEDYPEEHTFVYKSNRKNIQMARARKAAFLLGSTSKNFNEQKRPTEGHS